MPQHQAARRIAELGVTQHASAPDAHDAFAARRRDRGRARHREARQPYHRHQRSTSTDHRMVDRSSTTPTSVSSPS